MSWWWWKVGEARWQSRRERKHIGGQWEKSAAVSSIEDAAPPKDPNDAGLKKAGRETLTKVCGEYTSLMGSGGKNWGTL
jgi:hypothetical protein